MGRQPEVSGQRPPSPVFPSQEHGACPLVWFVHSNLDGKRLRTRETLWGGLGWIAPEVWCPPPKNDVLRKQVAVVPLPCVLVFLVGKRYTHMVRMGQVAVGKPDYVAPKLPRRKLNGLGDGEFQNSPLICIECKIT